MAFVARRGSFSALQQGSQVCIPWTNAIVLPEVNAGLTDTDLLGDFGNGQPALDTSVAQKAGKAGLTRQLSDFFIIRRSAKIYWCL
jgi:hypothetical protein